MGSIRPSAETTVMTGFWSDQLPRTQLWDGIFHSRINIPIRPYPLFFSPSPSINLIIMCVRVRGQGPCLIHLGIIQGPGPEWLLKKCVLEKYLHVC